MHNQSPQNKIAKQKTTAGATYPMTGREREMMVLFG